MIRSPVILAENKHSGTAHGRGGASDLLYRQYAPVQVAAPSPEA